jgi:predicted small integral membrane protein
MRRSPIWRPLFALFGGVASRSYVEIDERAIRFVFGLFDETVPLGEVESARPYGWPLIGGLGWRTNFFGSVAIVASYKDVVEVRLRSKRRMRFLLPFLHMRVDRVFVSLEDAAGFLAALRAAQASPRT